MRRIRHHATEKRPESELVVESRHGARAARRRRGIVVGLVVSVATICACAEPAFAAKPTVSVADASVGESARSATVDLSLSTKPKRRVTVTYATADRSARVGADYTRADGSVRFRRGKRFATVEVGLLGDGADEPDETFAVEVDSAKRARIAEAEGLVTIVDDDAAAVNPGSTDPGSDPGTGPPPQPPALSITTDSLDEGGLGTNARQIDGALSGPAAAPASVDFTLTAATASAGTDFAAAGGTISIPAGATTVSFPLDVLGDTTDEFDETLTLALSDPQNMTLAEASHTVTITDDDNAPTAFISTESVAEGTSGTHVRQVDVALTAPSAKPISVAYATASGTAASPGDFTSASGTLTFPPGDSSETFNLTTVGDYADEPDETVLIDFSSQVNVSLPAAQQSVTILDDDPPCVTADPIGTNVNLGSLSGDGGSGQFQQNADIDPCGDVDWYRFTLREDSSYPVYLSGRVTLQSATNDSPNAGNVDLCVRIGTAASQACSTGPAGATETIDVCVEDGLFGTDTTEFYVLVDGVGDAVNRDSTLTVTGNTALTAPLKLHSGNC